MAGPGDEVAAAKQTLRLAVLSARAALTAHDRAVAGAALAQHGLDRWSGLGRLAAYLEFGTEPPTRPLLDALTESGTEILVPIVSADALEWVRYEPGGPAVRGALGVDEPTGARLGSAALATVEVVLVPALAVDRSGNRLGRGRGYYDRALAAVTVPVIAVGYDDELVETVPVEPHDRRVQAMLRPAGYVPF